MTLNCQHIVSYTYARTPGFGNKATKIWCDYKSNNYVNLIDWGNIVPIEVVPEQVLVIRLWYQIIEGKLKYPAE